MAKNLEQFLFADDFVGATNTTETLQKFIGVVHNSCSKINGD